MNVVLGFVGLNAQMNFSKLIDTYHNLVQSDQGLNTVSSPDENAIFALSQPGGYFPLDQPFFNASEKLLIMLNGYFWYHNHFPLTEAEATNQLLQAGKDIRKNDQLTLGEMDGGVFNLFSYDAIKKRLIITGDYSGIMPIYFHTNDQGFFFSSHIRVLSNAFSSEIDRTGVIERVSYHYTIGRRTVFKDVYQKNLGETIIYSLDSKRTNFVQPTAYYSETGLYKSDMDAIEKLHHAYMSGVKELMRPSLTHGVFLSGGFDTRLVVYGMQKCNASVQALTLGDTGNFEVNIAKKVSNQIKSSHQVYTPISDCQLEESRVQSLMQLVESVAFPYCETGAQILKNAGSQTISTGFAGETIFGGQGYSLLGDELSSKKRLALVFKRMIGFPIGLTELLTDNPLTGAFEFSNNYHRKVFNRKMRFFSDNFLQGNNQGIYAEIQNDILIELSRYANLYDPSLLFLLERFWYEHHVSKEFGGQERTINSVSPILLPTVHHSFLSLCTNLPPERKLDHGIYLKFIKHYFGDLAKIPTSNVPIPLNLPIFFLWSSRAIRAFSDQKKVGHQISKKKLNISRMGWSNFESWFRQGDFLEKSVSMIDFDVFSEKFIVSQVEKWIYWQSRIYSGQDLLTLITVSNLIA